MIALIFAVFICVVYAACLTVVQQYGDRRLYIACLIFAGLVVFALGFTL